MSAFLQVYSNSGCTTEVAHTTDLSSTLNGATVVGATSIALASTTGWPTQGAIDIIDGTNGNETVGYYGLSGNTIQLTSALTKAHATGLTVNEWYYSLPVGDQVNGILNDGSNASPDANNTATWWIKNTGNQTAQNITIATQSGAPSTTSGYSDTKVSITSGTAGFATSVAPANLAAAGIQEFWVVAEVPSGQSNAGNPQVCVINLNYQSV